MTSVMGYFDDIGMEHYDDKSSGCILKTRAWSILMTGPMEHCNEKGRENCDDLVHGAM